MPRLAKLSRPAVVLLVVSDSNGQEIATGTGFFISADGKLITNNHVIENAHSIIAKTENDAMYYVQGVLASSTENDTALLQVKAKEVPFLKLGESTKSQIGERVAVIGSPLGLEGTLSEGIISAKRELSGRTEWLQISAAISPGSSGSPVLNTNGEVIGVATLLVRGGQSLNFAVPVEVSKTLLAGIKTTTIPQPFGKTLVVDKNDIQTDQEFIEASKAILAAEFVKALKLLESVSSRFPESNEVFFNLGFTFDKLNFQEDAIHSYRQAIKLKPDDYRAWNNLALCLANKGMNEEAIAAYREAIKIMPGDFYAWYNMGLSLQKIGKPAEAEVAYRQAIKINPETAEAWYSLGWCLDSQDKKKEAITALQQAVKLKSDYMQAWYVLGLFLAQDGQKEKVKECVNQLRTLDPKMSNELEKSIKGTFTDVVSSQPVQNYDEQLKTLKVELQSMCRNFGITQDLIDQIDFGNAKLMEEIIGHVESYRDRASSAQFREKAQKFLLISDLRNRDLGRTPAKKNYPYGIKSKWPGLITSPYAPDKTLIDCTTLKSGSLALCPHTGKIFIVP